MSGSQILLVEDEPLIAMALQAELEDVGFEVSLAYSGAKALELFAANPEGFVCLVTDIRLPESLDGWKVANSIRARRSTLPVVYMSGDSSADWKANGVESSVMLSKPFEFGTLSKAISAVGVSN